MSNFDETEAGVIPSHNTGAHECEEQSMQTLNATKPQPMITNNLTPLSQQSDKVDNKERDPFDDCYEEQHHSIAPLGSSMMTAKRPDPDFSYNLDDSRLGGYQSTETPFSLEELEVQLKQSVNQRQLAGGYEDELQDIFDRSQEEVHLTRAERMANEAAVAKSWQAIQLFDEEEDVTNFIFRVLTLGGTLYNRYWIIRRRITRTVARLVFDLPAYCRRIDPLDANSPGGFEARRRLFEAISALKIPNLRPSRSKMPKGFRNSKRKDYYILREKLLSYSEARFLGTPPICPPAADADFLSGKKAFLRFQWFSLHQILKPGYVVACNTAAWLVLADLTGQLSLNELARILKLANVFILRKPVECVTRAPFTLFDYCAVKMPLRPTLTLYKKKITSASVIRNATCFWKKDKKLVEGAIRYLEGGQLTIPLAKLEGDLERSMVTKLGASAPDYIFSELSPNAQVFVPMSDINSVRAVEVTEQVETTPKECEFQGRCNPCSRTIEEGTEEDMSGADIERKIVQFIAFIVSVFTQTNVKALGATIVGYLSSIPTVWARLRETVLNLLDRFTKAEEVTEEQFSYQGFGAVRDWMYDEFEVFRSIFLETCVYVLSGASESIASVIRPLFGGMPGLLRKEMIKQTAKDVAAYFLQHLKQFGAKVIQCFRARSFIPLYGARYDPVSWVSLANVYMDEALALTTASTHSTERRAALVREGVLDSSWTNHMNAKIFVSILEHHQALAPEIKAFLAPDIPAHLAFERVSNKFSGFVATFRAKSGGGCLRPKPLGIFYYGPTRQGKTTLSKYITKAIARKFGKDESPEGTYAWCPGHNYQEAFDHRVWAVDMDDVDQVDPLPTGVNHITENVALNNNNPYQSEKAEVTSKRDAYVFPLLINYTTNFANAKIHQTGSDPIAFWGRFPIRVYVTIKEEYKNGDGDLDRTKASGTYDVWNLDVFRFSTNAMDSKSPDTLPYVPVKRMSFSEFTQYVLKHFKAHMMYEFEHVVASTNPPECICPNCMADITIKTCGCGTPNRMVSAFGSRPRLNTEQLLNDVLPGCKDWVFEDPNADVKGTEIPEKVVELMTLDQQFLARQRRENHAKGKRQWPVTRPGDEDSEKIDFNGFFGEAKDAAARAYDRAYNYVEPKITRCQTSFNEWTSDRIRDGLQKTIDVYLKRVYEIMQSPLVAAAIGFLSGATAMSLLAPKVQGMINPSDKSWVRADQTYTPALPLQHVTWTIDQLKTAICNQLVEIQGPFYRVSGLIVGDALVLAPTHVLSSSKLSFLQGPQLNENDELTFTYRSSVTRCRVSTLPYVVLPLANQLVLIKVNAFGGSNLAKFMYPVLDSTTTQFDAVSLHGERQIGEEASGAVVNMANCAYVQAKIPTQVGDCGKVYIATTPTGPRILAMHVGGVATTNRAYGAIVTMNDLLPASNNLGISFQGATLLEATLFTTPPVSITHYPIKSSVYVGLTRGAYIIPCGTVVPQLHSGSLKSKVCKSILADKLMHRELEMCPTSNYFRIPIFKGCVVQEPEPHWLDPPVKALSHTHQDELDHDVAMVCVRDMIQNISLLEAADYRPISFHEAIAGLSESFIRPTDLTTSIGPPYVGPKMNYISRNGKDIQVDPRITALDKMMNAHIQEGLISVCAQWCLKDEPVVALESAPFGQKAPRVFINPPANLNFLLREHLAGVVSFIRSHRKFFETAVGIDMTSFECNEVTKILQRHDPSLENITEEDVTAMDKSWTPAHYEYVSKVFYAIAKTIGNDADVAERLIRSIGRCTHRNKSDLFMCSQLPSGVLVTVEMNSICLALAYRYGYYLQLKSVNPEEWFKRFPPAVIGEMRSTFYSDTFHEYPGLTFRDEVSLITYGDDSLRTGLYIDPHFTSQWGLKFQSARNKGQAGAAESISEVTFLKRNFRFLPELGFYVAPLSKKSMFRMLVMKKSSILSLRDHACVSITEFMREAVYHGPEFYQSWLTELEKAAQDLSLESPYLRLSTYDELYSQIKNKTFRPMVDWASLKQGTPGQSVMPEFYFNDIEYYE